MNKGGKLSRRDFLRLSAVAAAGTIVAACGGPAATPPAASPAANAPTTAPAAGAGGAATPAATTAPVAAPSQFKEAPMLADMVKAGTLPPVDQRLPKKPYVPPHAWLSVGNYGGTMQWTNSWGGEGIGQIVHESMYGHSLLRWLKDGLEIGPGLAESWEHNDDTSKWTFHFREGLKWSDGQPFTVSDIMYWWDDMINNPDYGEENTPPDEARSGKGTLAKFNPVDDYTLEMIFDAPAPLTADRIAMWVNAGIGPRWLAPKHYLQQFHPKYNKDVKNYKDHIQKMNSHINPDCPVLTGWKLKEYKEGEYTSWERNPYYWAVDKEGNQLPYIDAIVVTGVQSQEVEKLRILDGKIDWSHHWVVALGDVSALKQAQDKTKLEIRFWDSGSGSGENAYFFSYDYVDEKMRNLIRMPEFRQALSHAYNRPEIQKSIYFNTGELTTGTLSPKAIEYNINDEGKQVYASWRDSALKYDPELAKQMLDKIGVKAGADGKRTFPDGSPLKITLDYKADANQQTIAMNELLAKYWQSIGLDAQLNPHPPQGWLDDWYAGKTLSNAGWGIGDGPNHLVYPQWLVPIEHERWAPLEGNFYALRGTPKVSDTLQELAEKDKNPWERTPPRLEAEKGGPVEQLWKIYDQTKVEPDPMKRHKLVWDMIKIHVAHGPFVQGNVANFPRPYVVKQGLTNVPKKEDLALGGFTDPWIHPTPAVYDPETWFWDNPDAHK
jgi:peptide/nickel transport system substrate-binding protein